MPHVLGFAGGGMNPRYINVGSGSDTQVGAGLVILPTGEVQTTGVGRGSIVGNARGIASVDLQVERSNASYVASGQYSSIVGGKDNRVSGNESVAGGYQNFVPGSRAAAFGFGNTVGGYSLACGSENNLTVAYGSLGMGTKGLGRRTGELVIGNGVPNVVGAAQTAILNAAITTSNATPTALTLTLGGAIVIADDSTVAFSILLVARRTDADNESAGYKFEGVIDRNSGAATTALVGAVTKTVLAEDTAAWDANVTADTTNGGIAITVTGEAAKTIRWLATVTMSEVTG